LESMGWLPERPAADMGSAHLRARCGGVKEETPIISSHDIEAAKPSTCCLRERLRRSVCDMGKACMLALGTSPLPRMAVAAAPCLRRRMRHWPRPARKRAGRVGRAWDSLVDGVVAAGEGLEVADVLEHFWRKDTARSGHTARPHTGAPCCAERMFARLAPTRALAGVTRGHCASGRVIRHARAHFVRLSAPGYAGWRRPGATRPGEVHVHGPLFCGNSFDLEILAALSCGKKGSRTVRVRPRQRKRLLNQGEAEGEAPTRLA
jgi:hypothetical protein